MNKLYFITHPEVEIDPDIEIAKWPLSEVGLARMRNLLKVDWVNSIEVIYSSTEQKAIDGTKVLAEHLELPFEKVEELGENDRSSTGFLERDEFEETADRFFAEPLESIRGWERAVDAQRRIVLAVEKIVETNVDKNIAIISHGAVGALLMAHLKGAQISREFDQPGEGGGNYFVVGTRSFEILSSWSEISPSL